MGLIRDALIGIVLYEAVNYVLKIKSNGVLDADGASLHAVGASSSAGGEGSRPMEYSANEPILSNQDFDAGLAAGADPETLLTGDGSLDTPDDTWKNSLANDELRAPDS
jgi:hypothetical protein